MKHLLQSFVLIVIVSALWSQANGQTSEAQPNVSVPGKDWALVITDPSFKTENSGTREDGRQFVLAKNDKDVIVSIMLDKSAKVADPNICPGYLHEWVKRISDEAHMEVKNVHYSTRNGMATAEFLAPDFRGKTVNQESLLACNVKEDVYIDIHVSKTDFQASDDPMLTSSMDSVRFVSIAQLSKTASADQNDSRYYMNLGNQYFLKQQYQQAIEPYQKALDLEKQNPKLDKNMWRVLLDQLGMSYGISGNLDKAEVVFQYGLSKDPDYPMFSYNMACDYAERGNLDQTLAFLKQAFANKQNIIPGETMPDPRTDDSFQRFLNNPKFQALMKELNIH